MHMARVTYLFPPLPTHKTHRCLLVRPPPGIGCWRCWLATQWCWCFVWAPPELDRELSPYYVQRVPLYYSTTVAIIFKYSSSVYIYNIPCYQHKLIKRHNHPENELINTLSYQINPLGDHLSCTKPDPAHKCSTLTTKPTGDHWNSSKCSMAFPIATLWHQPTSSPPAVWKCISG